MRVVGQSAFVQIVEHLANALVDAGDAAQVVAHVQLVEPPRAIVAPADSPRRNAAEPRIDVLLPRRALVGRHVLVEPVAIVVLAIPQLDDRYWDSSGRSASRLRSRPGRGWRSRRTASPARGTSCPRTRQASPAPGPTVDAAPCDAPSTGTACCGSRPFLQPVERLCR